MVTNLWRIARSLIPGAGGYAGGSGGLSTTGGNLAKGPPEVPAQRLAGAALPTRVDSRETRIWFR